MTDTATTPPADARSIAHACANVGLRVLPIPPGRKHPPMAAWQDAATTDHATIDAWWTGLYADHGVGLAPDQLPDGRWWFAVDIDQHGVDGAANWADLCDGHGGAPATVEATTGGGGTHLLYAAPTEIRNGRLTDGIDIRGHGGQIVTEPSIHPSGTPYAWVDGQAPWEHPIADAPGWLLAILAPAPAAERITLPTAPTGDRPGDLWAASTTWAQILEPDGWTLSHVDRDGCHHWTRPGKDTREGTSATTGHHGSPNLHVFTSSLTHWGLEPDEWYTPLGYLAATRHHGDHAAAASALRDAGWHATPMPPTTGATTGAHDATEAQDETGTDEQGDWAPLDLTGITAGTVEAPEPTLLRPTTGSPLIYPGRVNSIFGEPGVGKTWVTLVIIAEAIRAGHNAIIVDLEDTPHGIVSRLLALGLTRDQITTQLDYLAPQTPWGPAACAAVLGLVDRRRHAVAIIDSTGEAMAMGAIKGNNDDEVAVWFRSFPRAIADRGPAVIVVDHVPKATDAPTGYAIGSQRKLAAVTGSAWRIEAIRVPSRTDDGALKIVCAKDRNGHHQKGSTGAILHLSHDLTGTVQATIAGPDTAPRNPDGTLRPTGIMEKISLVLEDGPPLSAREIEARVPGKSATIREALRLLVVEDWIDTDTRPGRGGGFVYRSLTPFREDPRTTLKAVDNPPTANRVPTASQPRPTPGDAVPTNRVPDPPTPKGSGRGSAAPKTQIEAEPRPAETGTRFDTDDEGDWS